jgi:type II secretory pathway pseudopilin PulG
VALMAGIAVMIILSTVAAQKWSDVIRRDNEAEMMFRAQDLVRGIKRFQNDKGRLPTSWDELKEPGQKGQYFIRHLWKDPLVKGGKWQIVYASPQGGIIDPSAPTVDPGAATGAFPSASPGRASGRTGAATGSLLASTDVTAPSSSLTGGAPGSAGVGAITKNTDGTAELAGLPIAGVKSRCTERTFRIYKDKDEYSQWIFSVFDLDQPQSAVTTPGTVPGARAGQPGGAGNFPPR